MGPSSHSTCVCRRRDTRENSPHSHSENKPREGTTRRGPSAGRGERSCRNQSWWYLGLGLLTSRTIRTSICVLEARTWYIVHAAPTEDSNNVYVMSNCRIQCNSLHVSSVLYFNEWTLNHSSVLIWG